ncbi:MAG: PilN domain-containing protein [Chromatiales bacterium]|nr:PilN domain-containing protein [Chromatiales bacterium]
MMQQINLYQPIFRKEQKIFSAKTLLIGNLLVLIGLGSLYAASLWQGKSLQAQLEQTIKQRDDNRSRITQLAKQYPQKKSDPSLDKKIARARNHLEFMQKVSTTLFSKSGGVEGGFSGYIAALSRQDPQQLWLSQITILQGGSEIRLQGLTTESERVPNYIQRLSREHVFNGTSFHRLSINRLNEPKQDHRLIRFTLETALKPPTESEQSADHNSPIKWKKRWDVKSPGQILDEKLR